MGQVSKQEWLRYFKIPNPGLRSYFEHVRMGNSEEYRTTFFAGRSLEDVLNGWKPHLAPIKYKYPSLFEFENDLRKKVGPMSIMKPLSQRMEDIESYYESISLDSEPLSKMALDAVIEEWAPIRGLEQRAQADTWFKMKKSTNSGSPYFTKRKVAGPKTLPCQVYVNGTNVEMIQGRERNFYKGCAVLGWRGQEGGPRDDDVKQRVVWMFPLAVNVRELQVYQPLIEACQLHNLVPAWVSMEEVDKQITRMFDSKAKDDLVICTDFSKFDQHFNHDMQCAAQYVLRALMTNSVSSAGWLREVFPIKYMIPLAYDIGCIRFGIHGMGSGSGGTNADETITHRALQYEAAQSIGSTLNPYSQCLGDDGVLTYPGISVDNVMQAYSRHGQVMNADKQYASKHNCIYLRRWHQDDYRSGGVCVGVYSTYRALGRLCEQERFYDPENWGPEMVALRQLSILENVKYHPLREEFLRYCMRGDRYRLGIDLPGFLRNIESIAREAKDLIPDFLGYTKSLQLGDSERYSTGIDGWWVVNALRSMR